MKLVPSLGAALVALAVIGCLAVSAAVGFAAGRATRPGPLRPIHPAPIRIHVSGLAQVGSVPPLCRAAGHCPTGR